jgi:DNA-binding transcriptional LysR family regulator
MDILDVEILVAAARVGSLAGAARQLGMTPMAASRRLAALERDLGVRLMHRTTRSISLTPEGEEFLPYARTMLDAAEEARSIISPAARGATGLLRITAPGVFGRVVILPLVPKLLIDHPAMRLDLQLSDSIVDIAGSGIDVAIRIAPLRDSELIARLIASNPRILCATPEYLARYGIPQRMEDLLSHSCLRLGKMSQWPFVSGGETRWLRIEGRFQCSSGEGIRTACLQGMGLALLTYWDIHAELSDGRLVSVELSDARPEERSIWAVLPTKQYVPSRVRVFLEALELSLA